MKPAPDFPEMARLLERYKGEKYRTLARLIDRGHALDSLAGKSLRQLRDIEAGVESPTYPPAQGGLFA